MPKRKDITIRFCFTKSEQEFIKISKFSEEELSDLRNCLSLYLDYRPRGEDYSPKPGQNVKIISVQIIHDSITPVEDEIEGYSVDRDCKYPLDGHPTPVVRFQLDRAMDEDEFLKCIYESAFRICTKSIALNGEEAYFIEDQNGYSSVLSKNDREQLIYFLECNDAYSGKKFNFPDGLPEFGYSIPAIEFAHKPA